MHNSSCYSTDRTLPLPWGHSEAVRGQNNGQCATHTVFSSRNSNEVQQQTRSCHTVCHQLKVQSLEGGWANAICYEHFHQFHSAGDYKVGFKSLPSASATNSDLITIKNQTLIYKLSAYHYWHMGHNCSRSPQSIPSREGALSLISLTTQVATFH